MGVSADGRDRWFCYVAHIQEEQVGLGDGVNSLLRCAAAGCWRGVGPWGGGRGARERGGGGGGSQLGRGEREGKGRASRAQGERNACSAREAGGLAESANFLSLL
jgi:hypothetical protein